jgi:CDP-glycerol glycerophosphotransferase
VMVDFAHTGRPMVFWTPDGDYYREHQRAVYLDPAELPGPAVETAGDMLAAAVAAARDGQPAYDEAYRSFRERYAPAGDGKATARAVDALLEG